MPALPASEEEATGKVPLTPDCTATRLTGARQSGCEGVTVGVGLEDRVAELLGVPVPVLVGALLEDFVAKLLGVQEGAALKEGVLEGVTLDVMLGVTLGVGMMSDAGRHGKAMLDRATAGTMLWPKLLLTPLSSVRPAPQQVAPPTADRVHV